MRARITRALGVAAAVALTVMACGSGPAGATDPRCTPEKPCTGEFDLTIVDSRGWYVKHVQVDGRDVPCVVLFPQRDIRGTSMSCDWSPR